ncbi:MAG: hypothetical protein AB7N91_07970 [Candidatus Tectimicrobiota bacterium]
MVMALVACLGVVDTLRVYQAHNRHQDKQEKHQQRQGFPRLADDHAHQSHLMSMLSTLDSKTLLLRWEEQYLV